MNDPISLLGFLGELKKPRFIRSICLLIAGAIIVYLLTRVSYNDGFRTATSLITKGVNIPIPEKVFRTGDSIELYSRQLQFASLRDSLRAEMSKNIYLQLETEISHSEGIFNHWIEILIVLALVSISALLKSYEQENNHNNDNNP